MPDRFPVDPCAPVSPILQRRLKIRPDGTWAVPSIFVRSRWWMDAEAVAGMLERVANQTDEGTGWDLRMLAGQIREKHTNLAEAQDR